MVTKSAHAAPRWYVIHCKPREDERALEHLQLQGFECYLPLFSKERLRDGRRYLTSEPLFPRYLFIRLDSLTDNWYPIRSTRGVQQIVRFNNGEPIPVRDEIIEGIRQRFAGLPPEPTLKPGERVQIVDGPFSNWEAIFLATKGEERAVLLLTMLQQEQRMVFPLEYVRKVG